MRSLLILNVEEVAGKKAMAKKSVRIRVSDSFRDMLKERSDETGLSMVDITRLASLRQFNDGGLTVRKKKVKRGNRARFEIELDDPFMEMFK